MTAEFNFYSHTNYRELLQSYIEFRKRKKQTFSYRWFAERAGYRSPNFLQLVIQGKRNLTTDGIERIVAVFRWNKSQKNYFRLLVQFNQCQRLTEKEELAKELLSLRTVRKLNPLGIQQFEYYGKWYNIPVRELLRILPERVPLENLALRLRPRISVAEVKESLQLMLDLGLIRKKGEWFEVTAHQITSGDEVTSTAVRSYHLNSMELAKSSLDRIPALEREISACTLTLTPDRARQAKVMIQEFRKRLFALEETSPDCEVVQFNFQMYPLSKRNGEQ